MAAKDKFRTPAMERAAGLDVLRTACNIGAKGQADKAAAHGYVQAIFGNVPVAWPNIMSGLYQAIDQELGHKGKGESVPQKETPGSPATTVSDDGMDAEQLTSADTTPQQENAPAAQLEVPNKGGS